MQPFSPFGPATKATVTAAGVRVPLQAWPDATGGSLCIAVRGFGDVFVQWGAIDVACTEATGHHCHGRGAAVFGVRAVSHLYLIAEAGQTVDVQISQGRGL